MSGFVSAIIAGPSDESAQTLSFTTSVAAGDVAAFSSAPSIDSSGELSYTFAADYVGVVTVTVSLSDSGGGTDTSTDQTFTLTSTAVNDAPSFTVGSDQSVAEDSVAQTVSGFVSAIIAGPSDESAQTLSFTTSVAAGDAAAFSSAPSIDPSGNLSYAFAADYAGVVTVSVSLSDNGGGADTSASQTFTLTSTAVNDAPTVSTTMTGVTAENVPFSYSFAQILSLIGAADVDNTDADLTVSIASVVNGTVDINSGGIGTTFTFTPALGFNGGLTFDYDVSDGLLSSSTGTATINVMPVAETPSLSVSPVLGDQEVDVPIALSISAEAGAATEVLEVTIDGLPAGSILSAGTQIGGSWTLTGAELSGLTLTVPDTFNGTINATVTATSIDGASRASVTSNLTIEVSSSFVTPITPAPVVVETPVIEEVQVLEQEVGEDGEAAIERQVVAEAPAVTFDGQTSVITVDEVLGSLALLPPVFNSNTDQISTDPAAVSSPDLDAVKATIYSESSLSTEEQQFLDDAKLEAEEEEVQDKDDVSFLVDEEALFEISVIEPKDDFTQKDLDNLQSLEDTLIGEFNCLAI